MSILLKKMANRLFDGFYSFVRNHRGVAMAEFAMLLPLLLLLAGGSFEVARYALITQKLDRIAATLSDLVARSETQAITETEITNIVDSALYMAEPFDFSADSMVVITSVQGRASQPPEILSQRISGSISGVSSAVGDTVGGNATLPSAFPDAGSGQTLEDGETLIIAEVFYKYEPYLLGSMGVLNNHIMYRDAYFRPRFTDTITFPSS